MKPNSGIPASIAEQRLWSIEKVRPRDPALNLAVAFELTGELNTTALEQASNEVMQRHEILRSRFEIVLQLHQAF